MIDLDSLFHRIPRETARTLIEQARISVPGFAEEIESRLLSKDLEAGGVFSDPLIEGAFPWQAHPEGWACVRDHFHPRALETLKNVAFPPYTHQAEAWKTLSSSDIRSLIVSSGTGSGKTECFLAPVLNSLVTASEGGSQNISGVHALMLYPLNALINSQEERLSKWLKPFNGALRYCLYNGSTPEQMKAGALRSSPEKVADRRTLRIDPPPILVTNITMLEYMMVRRDDAPIINKSRGKLEYIILDEAHTYIGAQAAELSLLLRRVAAAFGKTPEQIRYVATSATIGDGSADGLRDFLAQLAGVDRSRVEVIQGKRAPVANKGTSDAKISLRALANANPAERAKILHEQKLLTQLRQMLCDEDIISWSDWKKITDHIVEDVSDKETAYLEFFKHCLETSAKDSETLDGDASLLPVRLHLFHKTLPGMWVCVNPNCSGKPAAIEDWDYGAIELEERDHCRHCDAIMLEWVGCRACGDGALRAQESESAEYIVPTKHDIAGDDFIQELDIDEDDDTEPTDDSITPVGLSAHERRLWLSAKPLGSTARHLNIDRNDGKIAEEDAGQGAKLYYERNLDRCPHCGENTSNQEALRPIVAGAPYLVRQSVPILLSALSKRDNPSGLPMGGRSMITFTDARQGTAGHALNLQQAAEREFVRGFLYHSVHRSTAGDPAALAEETKKLEKVKGDPDLYEMFGKDIEKKIQDLSGTPKPIPVRQLAADLSAHTDIQNALLDLWSAQTETIDSADALAEFLLMRELIRRPKWAASAETLGLIRMVLPEGVRPTPSKFLSLGFSDADWPAFLELIVTHFLRQNQMITVSRPGWLKWAGVRGGGRFVVRNVQEIHDRNKQKAWLNPSGEYAKRNALISLVASAAGISLDDPQASSDLQECFDKAFDQIRTSGCLAQQEDGFRLDWTRLSVERVLTADICPVTRFPLQRSLKSKTIYADPAKRLQGLVIHGQTRPVEFPPFPYSDRYDASGQRVPIATIDTWLRDNEQIQTLRAQKLWDNRTDRAVRLEGYFRTAEHSAQISQSKLKSYEEKFRNGKINVLSCSTTMEMGVDIGEVEGVLLTNAPPAIANYKQRIGRGGRRGQSVSVGLTLCKNRPLDNEVAENPKEYFRRQQSVPSVSLDSPIIVQRHVNAWLLAKFFREADELDLRKLNVGGFFGLNEDADNTPLWQFVGWLEGGAEALAQSTDLIALVRGTPLPANTMSIRTCRQAIIDLHKSINSEWEALGGKIEENADNALARAQKAQRKRLSDEYLLSALASSGFLPAYGFPTNVVQFWTETSSERKKREQEGEDRRFTSRGMPSRQRNVAIYEYAPGSEIVIDGVMRRSAGITLNWQRPVTGDDIKEVQSLRAIIYCRSCGSLASSASAALKADYQCLSCGEHQSSRLTQISFIAPGGFTVDRYDEVTDQRGGSQYNSRPEALISATGATWRPLPDPSLGRMRSSAEGLVFDRNDGANGCGFAICLECGRAAPEVSANAGELPSAMIDHKPLMYTPNGEPGERCPGLEDDKSFRIQRNIRLGEETRTSVFELQLKGINSKEAARTLAIALREAIARQIGIEPNEMGVGRVETLDEDGKPRWTAVVFDHASGGAGFASQIADNLVPTIKLACDFLDCSKPGRCGDQDAKGICPLCLLRPDIQNYAADIERQSAKTALHNAALKLDLPPEFKVLGENSEYEPFEIVQAVRRHLGSLPASDVYVRATGEFADWDIEDWALAKMLHHYAAADNVNVSLLIEHEMIEKASTEDLVRIALACAKHDFSICTDIDNDWPEDGLILASGTSPTGKPVFWGRRDASALPGKTWGDSAAPLVRTKGVDFSIHPNRVLIDGWMKPNPANPIAIIGNELDGPVQSFGERFIAKANELAGLDLCGDNDRPNEIEIVDRYIFAPSVAHLYFEIVRYLADSDTDIFVRTEHSPRRIDSRQPFLLFHDWPSIKDRNDVMSGLLGSISASVKITPEADLPHRRTIRLRYDNGKEVLFLLDKGVASWLIARPAPKFDFNSGTTEQVQKLKNMSYLVECEKSGTYIAVQT